MAKKRLDIERWAVLNTNGSIVVVFEREKTSRAWAQWVADGKRGRRVSRVRISEIPETVKRAATKPRKRSER